MGLGTLLVAWRHRTGPPQPGFRLSPVGQKTRLDRTGLVGDPQSRTRPEPSLSWNRLLVPNRARIHLDSGSGSEEKDPEASGFKGHPAGQRTARLKLNVNHPLGF